MFSFTHADSNLVPEPIQDMFDRVRNSADFMPVWQMEVHTHTHGLHHYMYCMIPHVNMQDSS